MTKVSVDKITNIPETMLIPLYCKAVETKREKPIIIDPKAIEIVEHIDYDFPKFTGSWMSQLGVSIRTMLFDREVRNFIDHNENPLIINLGCGLDTRIERMKTFRFNHWYELDVPEAIVLRLQFFEETDKITFISKSIFDYSWIDDISAEGKQILFIAEGLFMYFDESELITLFKKLTDSFPGAEILLETIGPKVVGRSKKHDAVKHTKGNAEFKWGLSDGKLMEKWNPRIEYLNQWDFFDYHRERVRNVFMRFLVGISFFKINFGSKIIRLRFKYC